MKDNRIAWPLAILIFLLVAIPASAFAWFGLKRSKQPQFHAQNKPLPDPLPAVPTEQPSVVEEPSVVEVFDESTTYFHPATSNIIFDAMENADNSYDNLDNHD